MLDQGREGEGGGAAQPRSPQPLGPNPAPVLLRLPWGRQWGQGLVPLPQLKIAAGFVESPWGGGGRSGRSPRGGGVRPGRKCPVPCPLVKLRSAAEPLGKSRTAPSDLHGAGVPRLPRDGLPLTPATDTLLGLGWSPPRTPGRRGKVVLPPQSAPGDDLPCPTCQHPLFLPSRDGSPVVPRAWSPRPACGGLSPARSIHAPRELAGRKDEFEPKESFSGGKLRWWPTWWGQGLRAGSGVGARM